jgi:hypothetical protein
MNKAKYWLVQIALVAIVGLVLGSPVIAGGVNDHASDTGKANASLKAGGGGGEDTRGNGGNHNSGGNTGNNGGGNSSGDDTGTGTDPVCTSSDTSGCSAETCTGSWNDSTSTCSFF